MYNIETSIVCLKRKKSKFVTSVFDFLFVAARFTFEFCFLWMVYFLFALGTTLAPRQQNASMGMIHEPLPNSLLWTPRCGTWCDKCEKQNPARLILFYFDHSKLKHLLRRRIPTQFNPHKPTPGSYPLITMILKAKFD